MKNVKFNKNIRNIAIIAHVDHGKTTLVDGMFKQSGLFRKGQAVEDRIMDSGDIEKERGITITAKNCAVHWKDVKINIIDTPGHADFGGEVERALSMVDGAVLLVDASEGPLPQTRFVLEKALSLGLKIIVVVNKIDRPDARITEVVNEIYDLFIDLDASEDQNDFLLLYAIGKEGIAQKTLEEKGTNLSVLFDSILDEIPPPSFNEDQSFRMLVADLGYSDYLGRLAIGKIFDGSLNKGDKMFWLDASGVPTTMKSTKIQIYEGLGYAEVDHVDAGEIVVICGVEGISIGDTIVTDNKTEPLKRITVDEPTVAMKFFPNTSPLSGTEGKLVQASKIIERLQKESLRNVAIEVEIVQGEESYLVKGRGEFQMAVLIESMRREGFELTVSRPEVIYKKDGDKILEPIECLFIDCAEEFVGVVSEKLSTRKGKMNNLVNHGSGRVRIEFSIPSRSLIGYRDEFLTDTKGTGLMNSYLAGHEPFRGEFPTRLTGSIVADRMGKAVPYSLFNLEPRGRLFIHPGDPVYEGMVIGEHNRDGDINVNPSKEKKLSNVRASGKDEQVVLSPIRVMALERAINFITEAECVEVTPKSVRIRKRALNIQDRSKLEKKRKNR